jgi:putative ubiquitin-RnfH superfamily antitoxin RatB of RatAB toxin-antitoxin module
MISTGNKDQRDSLTIELCDARVNPPTIKKYALSQHKNESCSLLDALVQIELVKNQNDPLFLKKGSIGVFSVTLGPEDSIYDGDRIELYQPILIDPKQIRRKKANQNKDAELKTKAQNRKNRKNSKEF